MMIGPEAREYWSPNSTASRSKFSSPPSANSSAPSSRPRASTSPSRSSTTCLEDTNGTSANLAVEFSGPDSEVLLDLAGKTVDLLKTIPGAVDVNIEQEGPQPQLLIQPDRALCARYNVRIEDVTKLINTALGGDPIGVVYEGERKFDIVAKFDRQAINSAAGDRPAADLHGRRRAGAAVAGRADRTRRRADADRPRERQARASRSAPTSSAAIRTASSREAQQVLRRGTLQRTCRRATASTGSACSRTSSTPSRHFEIVLPITVVLFFGMLLITFRSVKAALLLLLVAAVRADRRRASPSRFAA